MNDFSEANKLLIVRTLGLAGCAISIFVPIMGLVPLLIAACFSYKQETIELKHAFYFDIIAIICVIIVFIITLVQF